MPLTLNIPRYDGRRITVSCSMAPLRDPATEEIKGIVFVLRDVTTAARLDQLKDEFISIAGHELQAPLATLMLACRVLERRAAKWTPAVLHR